MQKRVLDVGQCPPDHFAIRGLLTALGIEVEQVALIDQALDRLRAETFDLVLVNRKIDADYSDGLALIERMRAAKIDVPVMLISNYPEAQDEAVALGARRGFGKNELGRPDTKSRLLAVLNGTEDGNPALER